LITLNGAERMRRKLTNLIISLTVGQPPFPPATFGFSATSLGMGTTLMTGKGPGSTSGRRRRQIALIRTPAGLEALPGTRPGLVADQVRTRVYLPLVIRNIQP
jgi:hypothetical protein